MAATAAMFCRSRIVPSIPGLRASQLPARLRRVTARGHPPTGPPTAFPPVLVPRTQSRVKCSQTKPCSSSSTSSSPAAPPPSPLGAAFWTSRPVWRRALVNTLRCLVGCTAGDFSAMWYLQATYPDLAMGTTMAISMASGITTSLLLETVLLRYGRDGLSWLLAARTAAGMSIISMITMELAENLVDYYLTGGVVDMSSPSFWMAAGISVAAGLIAPLPYNYHRLRRYGKACH